MGFWLTTSDKENTVHPSFLASLSLVADILIIWKQILHCNWHRQSHLISILALISASWPPFHWITSYLFCSSILIEQKQFILQASQMAGACWWHSDHYPPGLDSLCTLPPLISIAPLKISMSKLPQNPKLWDPVEQTNLSAEQYLQVK